MTTQWSFGSRLTVFLTAAMLQLTAYTQRPTYLFQQMGPAGQLPDANDIMQDRDGLLWMSTRDGLYAYDGHTYSRFRFEPNNDASLCANHARLAFEDSRGHIWVAIRGCGVNMSDRTKRKFHRLSADSAFQRLLPDRYVTAIAESRDSAIWISGENGLTVLQPSRTSGFDTLPLASLTRGPSPKKAELRNARITKDHKDRIWIGTSAGLYMYSSTTRKWLLATDFPQLNGKEISDIEADRAGRIWVSCEGTQRFFIWNESARQFEHQNIPPVEEGNTTIRFCFDTDNRLWISEFGNGLFLYDLAADSLLLYNRVNSNIHYFRFVRTVFCDASGNIWICSDGIIKYPYPKGLHTYRHPYPFDQSPSVISLDDGILWIGYREAGLLRYDLTSHDVSLLSTASRPSLQTNLIFSFGSSEPSRIVMGMFGFIQILDTQTGSSQTYARSGPVRYIYQSSDGTIWISCYSSLNRLGRGDKAPREIPIPEAFGDTPYGLQTIAEDLDGTLWIASENIGLIGFDATREKFIQIRETSDADGLLWDINRITDLDIDAYDRIWMGTDAGLVRLNRDRTAVEVYTTEDGLRNDFVASVVCVDSTQVWVSTNDGLALYDMASGEISTFGPSDGLNSSIYYPRVRTMSEDGRIYFGGRNGVDFFNPADLRKNPYPPGLKITEIQIDEQSTLYPDDQDLVEGLSFSYRNQFLTIRFAGIHNMAPDQIQYQYQIAGLSDSWVDLGSQRELTLTGLSPGEYTFRLKCWSPDGVASEEIVQMPFEITPPFWDTMLFRGIATFVIIVIVIWIVRRREQAIQKKEEERSKFKKQMLDLEKRALLAQMNPHFIFNAMNSIQEYIFSGDNEGAMRYLTKFSRLLRNVLHVSSHQRIPLTDEVQLIKDYIELEKMRFPDKINYKIDVAPELDINTIEISPFLIQPQVENAIMHGILNKGSAGHIQITMQPYSEKAIRVVVEDNGIGREMAGKLKLANKFKHVGKSTSIVQERLKHNEATAGQKAYEIIDLYDDDNRACGTRVEMLLTTN